MRRCAKVTIGLGMAGMMMAVTLATAMRHPLRSPAPATQRAQARPADPMLARCRTITMPESACDAAWEARRRRFFGEDHGK